VAEAAAAAPVDPTKKTWKFWFNIFIILSIPASILVIVYGINRKVKAGGKATDIVKVVGEDPKQPKQQVTDHQKLMREYEEKYLKESQRKYQMAELETTPPERKMELWKEAEALAAEYIEKMTPILDNSQYQGEGYSWISKGVEQSAMLLRVVRDRIRSNLPVEEKPPAQPNTRALGIIATWNGTPQKLAVVFLPKDMSPSAPDALAMDFPTTLGRIAVKSGDADKSIEMLPLPAERAFELLRGTVKEEVEKLDAEAKKKRAAELIEGVQVFEGAKFSESLSFATNINGYYYKDQFARVGVRIHDDRGIMAFKEYYDLILQAIGTPEKGKESVSASFAEWKLSWQKEGVIYHLQAIGTKSGMDMTLTAYNEVNWKSLCDTTGETDPFQQTGLEDWTGKSPSAVPE